MASDISQSLHFYSHELGSIWSKVLSDCGANRECPNCRYRVDNSDGQGQGLPVGVKFDPSDTQLLKHLAAKCGVGNGGSESVAHPFIDDFIPTLEQDQGICYTHPQNLPGAKKDGSSIHFFHRMINAYATGRRKRRRIENQYSISEKYRWHKTGKTKPVVENGVHKGWKKIMVLHKLSKRVRKSEKSNWVMHQYHLGADQEEHDWEYVVSKILYRQPKQTKKSDDSISIEEPNNSSSRGGPSTLKTITPNPPRPRKSMTYEGDIYGDIHRAIAIASFEMDHLDNSGCAPGTTEASTGNNNDTSTRGISELENLEYDPFLLQDLQFGSQDSILSWLDQL
ncbi:hypothetical protein GQ457_04G033580 [Hibiscus cannabinus]